MATITDNNAARAAPHWSSALKARVRCTLFRVLGQCTFACVAGPWALVADLSLPFLRLCLSERRARQVAVAVASSTYVICACYFSWVTLIAAAPAADVQPTLVASFSVEITVADSIPVLIHAVFRSCTLAISSIALLGVSIIRHAAAMLLKRPILAILSLLFFWLGL